MNTESDRLESGIDSGNPKEWSIRCPIICRFFKSITNNGAVLATICGFGNAVEQVIVKLCVGVVGPIQFILYRSIIQLPVLVLIIICLKTSFLPPICESRTLVARCLTCSVYYILAFTSLQYLPYLDFLTIESAICCVFSLLLDRIFLNQKIHVFTASLMALSAAGLVCLSKPGYLFNTKKNIDNYPYFSFGALLTCFAGMVEALTSFSGRYLQETPTMIATFYTILTGLVLGTLGSIFPIKRRFCFDYDIIVMIIVSSLFLLLCFCCWHRSLQVGRLLECVLCFKIEIPLCFLAQYLIFNDIIFDYLDYLGITFTFVGILLITLKDYILAKLSGYNCFT